jgi:hypothetical protein
MTAPIKVDLRDEPRKAMKSLGDSPDIPDDMYSAEVQDGDKMKKRFPLHIKSLVVNNF